MQLFTILFRPKYLLKIKKNIPNIAITITIISNINNHLKSWFDLIALLTSSSTLQQWVMQQPRAQLKKAKKKKELKEVL
jgi:hypothetical protein